jgi:DNA-binding IclR family transcriptional regulator
VQRRCNASANTTRAEVDQERTDVQHSDAFVQSREGRGLSTARAVLKVLAHLREHPEGVRASEVALVVGKSVSTAYYLLTSLCEEGFALRDPSGGRYRLPRAGAAEAVLGGGLERAVEELFLRTHKRSYLGRIERGALEIVAVRGRQGMPRMPGLGSRVEDGAHALAMGKIVLALLPEEARCRYVQRGLRAFTPATIVDPDALSSELDEVRRRGVAVEREEFDADFCCVAAPVRDGRGRFVATIGLSATTHAFDAEQDQLVEVVRDVAGAASARLAPTPVAS